MLRFLTAGESHGPLITIVLEGLPAGLKVDIEAINAALARRQQGIGRGGRMAIERDQVEILSGLRFGETIGSPVTLCIRNRDWENWRERMAAFGEPAGTPVVAPRPGHADLAGVLKYGRRDIRDVLERASARETAARVAAGALCGHLLKLAGITVVSRVLAIGGCVIPSSAADAAESPPDGASEAESLPEVRLAIEKARKAGDTLGGIFEVVAAGVPPGLGSYVQWDRRLDARLAGAMMSIPAVKGVEIGNGFASAALPGSLVHDEIGYEAGCGFYRFTNRAGGIEGGMSNGEPIVVRAAMKPIPTLGQPLKTVNFITREPAAAAVERSDVTAVPAAAVVGEAMVTLVLAEALQEKFGGDTADDFQAAVERYRRRLLS